MWAYLTGRYPVVFLPYELFTATSWQTAKTVVCTLWTIATDVFHGIQIFRQVNIALQLFSGYSPTN